MKKGLLLVLAGIMSLSLLTGCGKSEEEKRKEEAQNAYDALVEDAKDYVEKSKERESNNQELWENRKEAQDKFFEEDAEKMFNAYRAFTSAETAEEADAKAEEYNKMYIDCQKYINEYYTEEDYKKDIEHNIGIDDQIPVYLIHAQENFLKNYEPNEGEYLEIEDAKREEYTFYLTFASEDISVLGRMKAINGNGTVQEIDFTDENAKLDILFSEVVGIEDGHVFIRNSGAEQHYEIDFTQETPVLTLITEAEFPEEGAERTLSYLNDLYDAAQ